MEKLTDEIVFEKEQEYRKNRKEIILDGLKKAKLSDSLYKISIKNVIVFGAIFIVGNGLVLANVDVNEVLGKGLAIVGTLSAFGAIGCDAYSGFLEKDVDETIKSLKEKDAVMNYKEEMNSSYMKSIIKMMNPKLFRKLNSSKLSDPVNIVTFSSLDKDEQDLLVQESIHSRELDKEETGLEILDLTNEENQLILAEAKRRRFI